MAAGGSEKYHVGFAEKWGEFGCDYGENVEWEGLGDSMFVLFLLVDMNAQRDVLEDGDLAMAHVLMIEIATTEFPASAPCPS